jgi:CheY-like chemotaxis protein
MSAVPRKQILVVDDSPLVLEMMSAALEAAGYDALVANDLGALDRHRKAHRPDLVLMDVQMPEAFGDDVAMFLRAARQLEAPIYLMSNLEERELKRRAAEAGLDGYIPKQLGADGIVQRVRQILGAPEGLG